MQLQLKIFDKNIYPQRGILVKGALLDTWLREIRFMELDLQNIDVYPIPDQLPNTIWGCLIVPKSKNKIIDIGRNSQCQLVGELLFIPSKAKIFPPVSDNELSMLLKGESHILYPEFGLYQLGKPLDWFEVLHLQNPEFVLVTEPAQSKFIPRQIRSFQVKPISIEDTLKNLESSVVPEKKNFKEMPLNLFEKLKLSFYQKIFGSKNDSNSQRPLNALQDLLKNLMPQKGKKMVEKMELDHEELERRNQKVINRLLDMLKNNPQEALKYAIPIDNEGVTRGVNNAVFDLSKKWFDFNFFDNNDSYKSGGSAILPSNHLDQLQTQYHKTAEQLIKEGDYRKAAFVYLKLLKNYFMAAQTLKNGKYYQEAASIYLKHLKNKQLAAECYELGNMTQEAIDLYVDLKDYEKAGDLYLSINQKKEANEYYQKVLDNLQQNQQFFKASKLSRDKMQNDSLAQQILFKGWHENKDAFNCLNNYFNHIKDLKVLSKEIDSICQNETDNKKIEVLLQVLKLEFKKENELATHIKHRAQEIVVKQVHHNPNIIMELKEFDKNDTMLMKDTLRYKLNIKR